MRHKVSLSLGDPNAGICITTYPHLFSAMREVLPRVAVARDRTHPNILSAALFTQTGTQQNCAPSKDRDATERWHEKPSS